MFCAEQENKLVFAGDAEPERETDGAAWLGVSHSGHSVPVEV